MPVYVVHTPGGTERAVAGCFDETCVLGPGLVLVDHAEHQSRVYHDAKLELPEGAPLFVARLDHQPKFKGMEAGSLNWVRERFDGMTA